MDKLSAFPAIACWLMDLKIESFFFNLYRVISRGITELTGKQETQISGPEVYPLIKSSENHQ